MSFAFLGAAPLAQVFAAGIALDLAEMMQRLAPLYLFAACAFFFITKANTPQISTAVSFREQIPSLLHNPGILAAWGAAVTVLFGFVSLHAGAQNLKDALNMDLQMLRLVGLPPLLLTFFAAPITRCKGAPFTARLGLGLAGCALVIAAIGAPWTITAASIMLSAGIAFAVPGLIATIAERTTNTNRGLGLALYTFSLFVGASLAPPVAQALAGAGAAALWLLPAGLLICAAIGISITRPTPST
jgi:hypothetical protein